MRATYVGHEALTFSDYIDLETGKTLHVMPGGVYDVAPASGHVVPEFPEPWFTRVGDAPEAASAAMVARRAARSDRSGAREPADRP